MMMTGKVGMLVVLVCIVTLSEQSMIDSLKNCGGLVCLNGGTLDLHKCTCRCHPMYTGNSCSELDCSQYESIVCSNGLNTIDCTEFYFFALCPVRCGRCPLKKPYVSPFGCKYVGPRYTAEQCNAFGVYGFDERDCASREGLLGCDSCKTYSNVAKDYCPVQCGICDPREPHISHYGCKFYGKRPTAEQCKSKGDHGKDKGFCATYNCKYCRDPTYLHDHCPLVCGLCDLPPGSIAPTSPVPGL